MPPRKGGAQVRRRVVFLLGNSADGPAALPSAIRSRHRCDRLIVAEPPARGADPRPSSIDADLLRSWRRIGAEHCSACLGVVAEPGAATTALAHLLLQDPESGLRPGAAVLLGYDPRFTAACRLGSRRSAARAHGAGDGSAPRRLPHPWPDDPPIMLLLPADDPAIAECASACRRLRALGVDVRLEVTAPLPAGARAFGIGALGAEAMAEMDAFFDARLEVDFPRLPGKAR